ncbi:mechanosensitive ion channel [Brachymonas denitrificans]|uniref:mechanosensitive ion channel n=1 Tax=Brachymonas denitrificans TaxID=28220 RepID=UPI00396A87FA
MDTTAFTTAMQNTVGSQLPQILGALAIFAIGWIIAIIARAGVRRLLGMSKLNQRINTSTGRQVDAESPIAIAVFWLILLAAVVAALSALNLSTVSAPLAVMLTDVLRYLPRIFAAGVIGLVAWVVATLIRIGVSKALNATRLDERLSAEAGMAPVSHNAGNVAFWLVILLFLPAILGALEMTGLLQPMQAMLDKTLAMAPNILAALMIGVVGWIVARILRGLVSNLLAAVGADNLGNKLGHTAAQVAATEAPANGLRLSSLGGTIVYIMVLVPALIAALDTLKIEAISRPATDMLQQFLTAVPHIIAAVVIVLLTWYVARFAAMLLRSLLQNVGADALPAKLGMQRMFSGSLLPSNLAGSLLMFFAMLFAVVEAANQLGFAQVSDLLTTFTAFGGDILLGSVIMIIGFWLANLAYQALSRADHSSGLIANIARFAILGLVIAMGLRAMGVANEIVYLAFGLTLGAVAVAVALAFGLGGREAAARLANQWVDCCLKGACKKDSALVLPDEAVAAKPAADNEGQPPLV